MGNKRKQICFQIKRIAALTASLAVSTLSFGPAQAAGELAQSFTLDGTLYDSPSGTNTLRDTVTIRVQILNPARSCVLYDETQTVNTGPSDGAFNIQVGSFPGSPRRTSGADPGLSFTLASPKRRYDHGRGRLHLYPHGGRWALRTDGGHSRLHRASRYA